MGRLGFGVPWGGGGILPRHSPGAPWPPALGGRHLKGGSRSLWGELGPMGGRGPTFTCAEPETPRSGAGGGQPPIWGHSPPPALRAIGEPPGGWGHPQGTAGTPEGPPFIPSATAGGESIGSPRGCSGTGGGLRGTPGTQVTHLGWGGCPPSPLTPSLPRLSPLRVRCLQVVRRKKRPRLKMRAAAAAQPPPTAATRVLRGPPSVPVGAQTLRCPHPQPSPEMGSGDTATHG